MTHQNLNPNTQALEGHVVAGNRRWARQKNEKFEWRSKETKGKEKQTLEINIQKNIAQEHHKGRSFTSFSPSYSDELATASPETQNTTKTKETEDEEWRPREEKKNKEDPRDFMGTCTRRRPPRTVAAIAAVVLPEKKNREVWGMKEENEDDVWEGEPRHYSAVGARRRRRRGHGGEWRMGEGLKIFGKEEGRRTGRRVRMKKEKEGVECLYMYVCENYH